MEKVIENFVEDGSDNGLLLIDSPTGSGKTYAILKYIHDAIVYGQSQKKYFFVTTLLKNLPVDSLKEFFVKSGHEEVFNEKVLLLKSNIDSVVDGLTPDVEKKIPKEFQKWDEFRQLKMKTSIWKETVDNKHLSAEYKRNLYTDLRENVEPAFRKRLQNELKRQYKRRYDRYSALHRDDNWKWVADLYPCVFSISKQVFFLSMDKFLAKNTPIYEPSYTIYTSALVDNSVVFIDEFDATKETALSSIIKNGLNDKVDYIELFNRIHSTLHEHEFPVRLMQQYDKEVSSAQLQSVIDNLKEIADSIHKDYMLQYNHRTDEADDKADKYFLFQDDTDMSVVNGMKKDVIIKTDMKKKTNLVVFSDTGSTKDNENLFGMLGRIRGFIELFQKSVRDLATNYQKGKNLTRSLDDDEYTFENAVRSVLFEFGINDDVANKLVPHILVDNSKNKKEDEVLTGLRFYDRGFRYFAFENGNDFDLRTKIMLYSFPDTPEKLLLRVCERAKVIGISATATIPSYIGNYDLEYLKEKLGDRFKRISDYDQKRLNENFVDNLNHYNGVIVNTKLVDDEFSKDACISLFDDSDVGALAYDKICNAYSSADVKDEGDYNKKRIMRIASVFKEFLVHDDIYSFLCELTKFPRRYDTALDKKLLEDIFVLLTSRFKPDFDVSNGVVYLTGDEFTTTKDTILARLGNGEKLFVISTYQTIGAGQNLQYPVPEKLKDSIVCLNQSRNKSEKDFDAIYLDKPTHILVNLDRNLRDMDFVKFLFQVEYLLESAEISVNDAKQCIKRAFSYFLNGRQGTSKPVDLYKSISVKQASTRTIIQAIGRICRTYMKSQNIYIFADKNIAKVIDTSVLNGRTFNYELVELMNAIQQYCSPSVEPSAINIANLRSARSKLFIDNILRNSWTPESMSLWKDMREVFLKLPTADEEELLAIKRKQYSMLYVDLPSPDNKYRYKQRDDFGSIAVNFSDSDEYPFFVSEYPCKLSKYMKIEKIKDFFISEGYATHFETKNKILTPPIFNNIYKGALGEAIGVFLFDKFLGIQLQEIQDPSIFELFDYRIPGTDVYVDFKNWNDYFLYSDKDMTEKIKRKADKCCCRCVLVVNIISSYQHIRRRQYESFELVEIPALIDEETLRYDDEAFGEITRCVQQYGVLGSDVLPGRAIEPLALAVGNA